MKSTIRRTGSPLMPPTAIADWTREAACRAEDVDLFFGPDHELPWQRDAREEKALAICRSCPVAATCLDAALDQGIWQWGVQGGMTADERTTERRRRLRRAGDARRADKPKPKAKPKPTVWVEAIGLQRRVQAASAAGRRIKTFSDMSGVSESFLSKLRAGRITRLREETAKKIRTAYPDVLAEITDVYPEPLAVAAAHGWPLPGAWGADIDDPSARPRETAAAA
ncbi:WhiB family transcriptional regulator [Nocardiopsis sp. CA-288880]|uniref:WhiB family transcriptional regulator n=1 Tax=Nocardiopsis sp. CA-288880 TaxID=3239995 RepID=UPI003D978DE1